MLTSAGKEERSACARGESVEARWDGSFSHAR